MTDTSIFTPDYKLSPFWWDTTPRPVIEPTPLPASVDVAVVGSGYTGLHAALQTCRGGRHTVVFDSGDAGFGCSTRNGGQISTSIKPDLDNLTQRYGAETAMQIAGNGYHALDWIAEFLSKEQFECDFQIDGRFHAAHSAKAFNYLVTALKDQPKGFEVPYRIVPRDEQHTELGTDAYFGGVVYEKHASIDPACYHQQLLDRVQAAGADVQANCAVESITPSATGDGFTLKTVRGELHAREVVIATNGYTGDLTPWLQRRVIPIGSYIIATDRIAPDVMQRLMPTQRIVSDTRKVVYYYRPSPDHTRILFGGRVSTSETDPAQSAPLLKRDLVALFPELDSVRISHSWMGFVAYTFDTLAHAGTHDGLHYAMGYCGSGVSMASYLGMRIGRKILGTDNEPLGVDSIDFPTRPLYTGKPWFLAPTVAYYRFRDRLG